MKIVHLSTRRDFYGGEVCLANLAAGMAARGHDVSCLLQPESMLANRLAGGPVQVVPMDLWDWFDPGTVYRVGQWLRHHHVDILATHLPRDYFIAAAASWGLSVCNIATRHQLKPISFPVLKRPFMRRFSTVVAVSEAVAAGLYQTKLVPADRIVTVPNGIAITKNSRAQSGVRARCGVPDYAPVIGLVGKLCPAKGAGFLLQAVSQLTDKWPDLQVILVGDEEKGGSYQSQLRKLATLLGLENHVHFLGFVPDVSRYTGEFDVQVVASQAEPFGLVTAEAMANGVPVVATASGGSPELIRDGVEGFLVPVGDVATLANRLDCLLGSPGLRQEMGARGRARYEAEFTVDQMIRRTEAVYEQALLPHT